MIEPNEETNANNEELDEFDRRLASHLQSEAALIPAATSLGTSTALDNVHRRADQRRARRQMGVGVVAASIVAGIGFGLLQVGDRNATTDIAATETSTTMAGETTPSTGDNSTDSTGSTAGGTSGVDEPAFVSTGPALAWDQVVEFPSGLNRSTIVGAPSGFYAIGFESAGGTSVYRSLDGRDWELIAEGLQIEGWQLTLSEGVLVLSGSTSPAFAEGNVESAFESTVLLSFDDGATWESIELPPTTVVPDPTAAVSADSEVVNVAAVGDTLVATRVGSVSPDFDLILDQLGIDDFDDFSIGENSVEVTVNGETTEVPFDELGLSPPELEALNGPGFGTVEVFRSVGGAPFESIEIPQLAGTNLFFAELTSAGDEFVIQLFGEDDSTVVRSSNGLDWSSDGASVSPYLASRYGQSLIGYQPTGGLAESLDGGRTWDDISFAGSGQAIDAIRNDLGLTLIGDSRGFSDFETIEFTKDGYTLSVGFGSEEPLTVVDNSTGQIVVELAGSELDDNGEGPGVVYDEETDTIEITDLDTGNIVMRFTSEEFAESMDPDQGNPEQDLSMYVGFTADGDAYSWQPIGELPGASRGEFGMLAATDSPVLLIVDGAIDTLIYVADSVPE